MFRVKLAAVAALALGIDLVHAQDGHMMNGGGWMGGTGGMWIPILLVVNVPARVIAQPFTGESWGGVAAAVIAAAASLVVSRIVFQRALARYRSASS